VFRDYEPFFLLTRLLLPTEVVLKPPFSYIDCLARDALLTMVMLLSVPPVVPDRLVQSLTGTFRAYYLEMLLFLEN
jgi:hypothetical protein